MDPYKRSGLLFLGRYSSKLLFCIYFLFVTALYSIVLDTEIGGRSRGFRLEYEVFRSTVHLVGGLEPRIFCRNFIGL